MEELFDIVDADDNPVGRAPRSLVHAQNLPHRAVHVLVFNGGGEIFLQKRSMNKDQCPGLWGTSCAGHVDAGEAYDRAAEREFAEELGLRPPALEALFKLPPSRGTGNEFVWIYRCVHDGPFALNRDEIDGGEWRSPGGLARAMDASPDAYSPSLRTVWKAYEEFLSGAGS